jgi:hypothetical protein
MRRPICLPIEKERAEMYLESSGVSMFSCGMRLLYILSRELSSLPFRPDVLPYIRGMERLLKL